MACFKKCMSISLTALLILSMAGCQENSGGGVSSAPPSSGSAEAPPTTSPNTDSSSNVIQLDSSVDWETEEYEDSYLTYQLPANWEENPRFSNEIDRLTFFNSSDALTETPSNINIQITSLTNDSQFMDYGDLKIQSDFYEFLKSDAGLPKEAKDSTFTVYQTSEFYVYAISFSRTVNDGTIVKQTGYVPVGLKYAIMIWATDWNDNTTVSIDEIAMHLCATLKIKDPPGK